MTWNDDGGVTTIDNKKEKKDEIMKRRGRERKRPITYFIVIVTDEYLLTDITTNLYSLVKFTNNYFINKFLLISNFLINHIC